ncbi:hypothetical protein PsorP6_011485 [Peronosclerospora sorghi]|uniref:Uncharacterized protein n=1 Tax=Peronosclerospora sorghi TaxID=230839 RepID=A0ACC0WKM6_9STRA|nr:hypothetical protein PsorP6_011485 [Peronosclerospora sorghi]
METVPEYGLNALELRHERTKAKYVQLDSKDTNNVFAILFRTPPSDSTGVPHILEHTVLCGSQRFVFPVRDPFFNMIKRSLNTYMNALTAADPTMYPFSTTNTKDWHNLMSVYLDAVFFPNLHKLDFLQEGHRLEISEGKLVHKGVVLNEMKGVLSDSNNLFGTRLQQELMRGTIYAQVSGDTFHRSLTYEELCAFRKEKYHPSNCCFYSYGDMPLTDHLAYLNHEVLDKLDYCAASASIHVQADEFDVRKINSQSPELIVIEGPSSNMSSEAALDHNTKYCMSKFVDVNSTDPFQTFVLRIVSYLLTNGPASPMFKALIESDLAQDLSVGTGFDTSTYYPTFGIGVEGIRGGQAAVPDIRKAVHDALEKRLKDEMARDSRFLQSYVKTYLLRDELREIQMLMLPSKDFVRNLERDERETLATVLMDKSNADLDLIAQTTEELGRYQQKEQPVECLPPFDLKDIPRVQEGNFDYIDETQLDSTSVDFVRVPSTNEVSYLRRLFDLEKVPQMYHRYMHVFTTVFGCLGTSRYAYDELPTVISNYSGGISSSVMTASSLVERAQRAEQAIAFTDDHWTKTLSLLHELTTDTQFLSDENLRQLRLILQSTAATASSNISSSGAALAAIRSRIGLTPASIFDEYYSGISHIEQLQDLAKCSENELRDVAQLLQDIARIVFSPANLSVSVVTEDKLRSQVEQSFKSKFLQPLARSSSSMADHASRTLLEEEFALPSLSTKNYFAFPLSVNFVVETPPSVSFTHEDHVPLTVLAQIMSSCHLHEQVRDQGGSLWICRRSKRGRLLHELAL